MFSRRWFILPFRRWDKEKRTYFSPLNMAGTLLNRCAAFWCLKKVRWRIIRSNGEALCRNLSITSMLPLRETHTLLVQTVTHITKNFSPHTTSFCHLCPVLMTLTGNPKLTGCLFIDPGGCFKFTLCSRVVPYWYVNWNALDCCL